MTKTPIRKTRSNRLRADDSPEKKTGGTRASSRPIVTMRSVGTPARTCLSASSPAI